MLKGTIYVTTDFNMAANLAATHKIICISDSTHEYKEFVNATRAHIASVLLPPTEASMCEIDGDMRTFINMYYNHLSNGEANMFISIILRAIYNGVNILLFLTNEESKMGYINIFMQYFRDVYGIYIGTTEFNYYFDINYYPVILTTLFMNNLMTAQEYIVEYPLNLDIIDQNTIIKLNMELKWLPNTSSIDECIKYFSEYRNKLKQYNRNIIVPITYGG